MKTKDRRKALLEKISKDLLRKTIGIIEIDENDNVSVRMPINNYYQECLDDGAIQHEFTFDIYGNCIKIKKLS